MTDLLVDEKNRQLELAAAARDRAQAVPKCEPPAPPDPPPKRVIQHSAPRLDEDLSRYLWRDQRRDRRGDPEYVWVAVLAQRMLFVMLGIIALALIGKAVAELAGGVH